MIREYEYTKILNLWDIWGYANQIIRLTKK
jgi:hypothetical protein